MRPLHAAATHPSAPLPLRTSPFAFFQGRKINVEIGRLPAELKFHFPAAGPGGSCRPIGLGAAATAQGGPGGGTKQGDSSTCPWSSGIHRDGSARFVHLAVEASTPGYGFPYWDCPPPPASTPSAWGGLYALLGCRAGTSRSSLPCARQLASPALLQGKHLRRMTPLSAPQSSCVTFGHCPPHPGAEFRAHASDSAPRWATSPQQGSPSPITRAR